MDDQAANDCDLEPVAYEFFTQAFVLYEEEIAVILHLNQAFVSICSVDCPEKWHSSGNESHYMLAPFL